MSVEKLPALPECDSYCTHKESHEYDVWSAEQMHAYGLACREQALEEAAKACESEKLSADADDDPCDQWYDVALTNAAKAIRARAGLGQGSVES